MTTVAETFGLRAAKPYQNSKIMLAPKTGVDVNLLYGVELEIEGLDTDPDRRAGRIVQGIMYHEDGSLRNNGGEYVTLPMDHRHLVYVLNQFFMKNKLTAGNYSERTSVHIHANCQDLTMEQLRLVLSLYQIMERVLFNFIKEGREDNIFCVPWSECLLGSQGFHDINSLTNKINRWKKYTALNLLPLRTQGTIEFRHMAGTHDLDRIMIWVDIIGSLFKFARVENYDDVIGRFMKLNTSSEYENFMQLLFDEKLYNILAVGNYRELLEEGIIGMKVMLSSPSEYYSGKAKKRVSTTLMEEVQALAARQHARAPIEWDDDTFVRDAVNPVTGIQIGPGTLETITLTQDLLRNTTWNRVEVQLPPPEPPAAAEWQTQVIRDRMANGRIDPVPRQAPPRPAGPPRTRGF
jgi:hypothetical protein